MNYRREIYYQEKAGEPHRKVTKEELEALIGMTLSSWLLSRAEYRIEGHPEIGFAAETTLQLKAFFEGALASVVVVADSTNHGNVFVQLVSE